MSQLSDMAGVADLPRVLAVFPLPGTLLRPGGNLPLHLFEPRYRDMIRDALGGKRIIGMIQPQDPDAPSARPPLYRIGCIGKIMAFRETDDGRYYVTLNGICRFDVLRELDTTTLYRQVEVDYDPWLGDFKAEAAPQLDREKLIPALKAFLGHYDVKVNWDAIDQVPDDALIRSLAMTCPFEAAEKQAILEAKTLAERSQLVLSLIEMANVPNVGGGDDRTLQ